MRSEMIVIGVNTGLARLGYGVIEVSRGEIQPVCYGIIETLRQRSPCIGTIIENIYRDWNSF